MSKINEWAGHLELALLSKLKKIKFVIYLSDGNSFDIGFDSEEEYK
jgi:hypothetical protein